MNRTFLILLVVCVALAVALPPRTHRKKVQGSPETVADILIPVLNTIPTSRDSSSFALRLGDAGDEAAFYVEASPVVTLSVVSPHAPAASVVLTPEGGESFRLENGVNGVVVTDKPLGMDGQTVPARSFEVPNLPTGRYSAHVTLPGVEAPTADMAPNALLLVGDASAVSIVTTLSADLLDVGARVGLKAFLVDTKKHGEPETFLKRGAFAPPSECGAVAEATLVVTHPDGTVEKVAMTPTGAAGVVEGDVEATVSGVYLMEARVVAEVDGHQVERSTFQVVPIAAKTVMLKDAAFVAEKVVDEMVTFEVAVERAVAETPALQVRAVVRGTDADGKMVVAAWAESIEEVVTTEHGDVLQVDVHERWLARAGVHAPYELTDVALLNLDHSSVLDTKSAIAVAGSGPAVEHLAAVRAADDGEVTEAMKVGPRPASHVRTQAAGEGKLMLVHGYCSGSVWPVEDFTNAIEFKDFEQSRSQDEFAQRILDFGEGLGAYSIVGHSQGGLAALHLKAFYWSGLDMAEGGRLLQSVGSPYQGCSMAGTLASLGEWFGAGCGSNYDLSTEGAQVWLATIPPDARKEVYYYTTQYKPGFLADCVTASNLVLHTPNDGTCEVKYSVLEGGNDMGHKENWCHTSDMKYPPQCSDSARNAEMDAAAAR